MKAISSEQLYLFLRKNFCKYYFIFGSDQLLLNESYDFIFLKAHEKCFTEYKKILIDKNTDWSFVLPLCKSANLFLKKKIIRLIVSRDINICLLRKKIFFLFKSLNDNYLLIIHFEKIFKYNYLFEWLKNFFVLYINCSSLKYFEFIDWLKYRVKRLGLYLDKKSFNFFCFFYKNNLIYLSQMIDKLIIFFPDGNFIFRRINSILSKIIIFNYNHWINSMLMGINIQLSYFILNQIKLDKNVDPVLILRYIKNEVLNMILLKYKIINNNSILFLQNSVVDKDKLKLMYNVLCRLGMKKLNDILSFISKLEFIVLSENKKYLIWLYFDFFILLFFNKI